jgi:hypothetical protein
MCALYGRTFFVLVKKMKYTKEQLQAKNLYALRGIGREIGVRAPSSLTKGVLIENILRVQAGIDKPFFSKSGRPSLDGKFTTKKKKDKKQTELIEEIDKILQVAKEKIIELIK